MTESLRQTTAAYLTHLNEKKEAETTEEALAQLGPFIENFSRLGESDFGASFADLARSFGWATYDLRDFYKAAKGPTLKKIEEIVKTLNHEGTLGKIIDQLSQHLQIASPQAGQLQILRPTSKIETAHAKHIITGISHLVKLGVTMDTNTQKKIDQLFSPLASRLAKSRHPMDAVFSLSALARLATHGLPLTPASRDFFGNNMDRTIHRDGWSAQQLTTALGLCAKFCQIREKRKAKGLTGLNDEVILNRMVRRIHKHAVGLLEQITAMPAITNEHQKQSIGASLAVIYHSMKKTNTPANRILAEKIENIVTRTQPPTSPAKPNDWQEKPGANPKATK